MSRFTAPALTGELMALGTLTNGTRLAAIAPSMVAILVCVAASIDGLCCYVARLLMLFSGI